MGFGILDRLIYFECLDKFSEGLITIDPTMKFTFQDENELVDRFEINSFILFFEIGFKSVRQQLKCVAAVDFIIENTFHH